MMIQKQIATQVDHRGIQVSPITIQSLSNQKTLQSIDTCPLLRNIDN